MKRLILSRHASRDLDDIADFGLHHFGTVQAARYNTELLSAIRRVAFEPMLQPRSCSLLISDNKARSFFYIRHKAHYVIYREAEQATEVLAFISVRRDMDKAFAQMIRRLDGGT